VVELTLVERGRAHRLADQPAADETAPSLEPALAGLAGIGQAVSTLLEPPRAGAATLLTAEEVGQALGVPVRAPEPFSTPGFVATATFCTADRGRQVLLVQVADGPAARWVWRANQRGTELPGIGDGAFLNGDRAALRAGGTTVLLTLLRDGKGRHTHLPWLLRQAAARLAPPPAVPV
jgi:hypothetical protein